MFLVKRLQNRNKPQPALSIEDILEEKFKIKPLTKAQIIISIDRLTRFKYTEDKYLRVFKELVTSNLIFPKYKKNELNLMPYSQLTQIVQNIFKFSLRSLNITLSNDFTINKKLLEYEKSVFKLDKNIQQLLENEIDYKAALTLLDEDFLQTAPRNLLWLKSLLKNGSQKQNREESGLKFPIEKIVLVEGITEEILLPKFAKICGLDFDKAGINLISAGGKNQVVKLFYQFADTLKLPMFVLLDNDAKENYQEIMPKLRRIDKIHVLDSGEFEDILPLSLIKRTLNRHFRNYFSISIAELRTGMPMTQTLEEIFKQRGLEFKKAEFASLVAQNITSRILSKGDVSSEIEAVVVELGEVI